MGIARKKPRRKAVRGPSSITTGSKPRGWSPSGKFSKPTVKTNPGGPSKRNRMTGGKKKPRVR
jgi:hypothetical protein